MEVGSDGGEAHGFGSEIGSEAALQLLCSGVDASPSDSYSKHSSSRTDSTSIRSLFSKPAITDSRQSLTDTSMSTLPLQVEQAPPKQDWWSCFPALESDQRENVKDSASLKRILFQLIDLEEAAKTIQKIHLSMCIDSKSLYECLVKLGTTQEKRLMIDILCLRQSYERRGINEILWIKGDKNPADAMTKDKGCDALRRLLFPFPTTRLSASFFYCPAIRIIFTLLIKDSQAVEDMSISN